MRFASLVLVVVTGCWRGPVAEPVVANHIDDTGYELTSYGVGAIDATSEATQTAIQALVPQARVTTRNLGAESGIVFDVWDGKERLFYVVPDDAPGYTDDSGGEHLYARTVFAVFAISPKVRVQGRSWRVGQVLSESDGLDVCECWGDHEVTACYRRHGHIRLVFETRCDRAEVDGPRAMVGQPIGRVMWKRIAQDADDGPPEPKPDPTQP